MRYNRFGQKLHPGYEKMLFFPVVPELRTVIGKEAVNELLMSEEATMHQALKKCFHSLMTCPKETIEIQLQILEGRLTSLGTRKLVFSVG